MNTVNIGDIGEAIAIAKFTQNGFVVSKPLSNNARYDFIVEYNNKLYKVQVKTTLNIKDESVMIFGTKSTNYTQGSWKNNRYTKEFIDVIFLYCQENNWCGLYFGEENGEFNQGLNIRLVPTKNGQIKGVKFAENYSFENQLNNFN